MNAIAADLGPATLTVEEAGELLGIGRSLAYEGVKSGAIPSLRIGRRIVVPRVQLERMLAGENGDTTRARED